MRITLVSTYPPEECGIASYTHYLGGALLETDPYVELSIVTPGPGPAVQGERLRVTSCGATGADYVPAVLQHVSQTRPDIVHIQHEYGIFGADERLPRLLSALTRAGVRTVVTMHSVHTSLSVDLGCGWVRGFSLEELAIEPYQRRIGELADLVVVHDEHAMRQPLLRQGLADGKVTVIPHGTLCLGDEPDEASDGAEEIPRGRPLLVLPGYLRPSKNVEAVIDAFAAVAPGHPDAVLWIGGHVRQESSAARSYIDDCLKRAAEAGVADRVVLSRRSVSEAAMSRILRSATIVLCVYDEDCRSASGILHRAIGAGAVVVGSRRPKFQEIAEVCDELLVDPGRPAELARLIDRLIDDDGFRQAVRRPLMLLAERTAWPAVARAHLDAYRTVAGEPAA